MSLCRGDVSRLCLGDDIMHLAENKNIQEVFSKYFDELMTIHSVICNKNIITLHTDIEDNGLLLYANFDNEEDCNRVNALLACNPIITRYNQQFAVRSILLSCVSMHIVVFKIKV